jgi:hypothetical protein
MPPKLGHMGCERGLISDQRAAATGRIMDDPRLQPAPETRLRELEARIETASADGSASVHDVVDWRQECLALAQIACHDDLFQLGRAACNLARAYLAAGMASSAVPHAERAESLLLASAARTESADLLPTALLALADSLAARASSLSRAAGPAAAKKEGRADPYDAGGRRRAAPPPPSRPARHNEARPTAGMPATPPAAAAISLHTFYFPRSPSAPPFPLTPTLPSASPPSRPPPSFCFRPAPHPTPSTFSPRPHLPFLCLPL